ncbi:MAG TPA: hypothetical protein VMF56_09145 [Acidobacteriaceae bacterium]|nr:hypothetical protein [Acidobacteriaceae bacterium]
MSVRDHVIHIHIDHVIHIHIQSVLLRVMNDVVLQVDSLDGVLAQPRKNEVVSLDDKNSFSLKVQRATTSISSTDLAALANDFILPRAKTPLKNLSLTFDPNQTIEVKGDFHKLVDIPFSGTASLHVTPDGNMRMHLANLTVAGVIHQDVLNFLGIKVSSVAKPRRKQSFKIVGNDIIFPIDQMFPPPHVGGQLHDINIVGNQLTMIFGTDKQARDQEQSAAEKPSITSGSYIFFHGGTMKFALLTMNPVNLELVPLKPDLHKRFEFSVDQYYQQLVAGYSKLLPNKGLLVYMADDREIQPSTQPVQK